MRQIVFMFCVLCASTLCAQVRVRDLFESAPDSVFPLLTKNNRLDCLDFMENKMSAKVKNQLNQDSELKTLTDKYLMMQMSGKSRVEMYLMNDSMFCMVRTYLGPGEDSNLSFYTTAWEPLDIPLPHPSVKEFWSEVPEEKQQEALTAQSLLADLPLIGISVQPDSEALIYTLSIVELPEKEKEIAKQYVKPITYKWNGEAFQR